MFIEEFVTFIGDCGRKVANVLFIPNGWTHSFFVELFQDGESIETKGPFSEDEAEELAANYINGVDNDTFI
jgi:hypothetical protein